MKRILLIASGVLSSQLLFSQEPQPTVQVAERGPHHAKIERVSTGITSYGKSYQRTNSYGNCSGGFGPSGQEWTAI